MEKLIRYDNAYVEMVQDVDYQEVVYTWEQWMDYFSRNNNNEVFSLWINDKWLFSTEYLIIEEADCLIIANKKSYKMIQCAKTKKSFVIEFNRPEKDESKKVFGFGNYEVRKNMKV